MCGRVEAVDIIHKKVVPILYIDPQETLFGKGKLGKVEIVEVPAKVKSEYQLKSLMGNLLEIAGTSWR